MFEMLKIFARVYKNNYATYTNTKISAYYTGIIIQKQVRII